MLARIQQLISLLLLAAVIAAVAVGARLGLPLFVAAIPAAIAVSYVAVLAVEFGLLWRAYPQTDPDRPRIVELLRAWVAEATGAPRVFLWRQPFRSQSEGDHLPASAQGRRGVLFVHGFFCNRGLWNPWMRRLRGADVPFIAVSLEPIFASIDRYRPVIEAAVRDLEAATSLPPVIVAHSMGGLAVRAWLRDHAQSERFHRVVTIASPHAGTRMAVSGFGANIRQMRPGSNWLRALDAQTPASLRERFVCFWGPCDNIVVPTRSATLAGAVNRRLGATPHVQMVYHPAVVDEVLRLVGASSAPSKTPP
jgi:triacylglycerol lipase